MPRKANVKKEVREYVFCVYAKWGLIKYYMDFFLFVVFMVVSKLPFGYV